MTLRHSIAEMLPAEKGPLPTVLSDCPLPHHFLGQRPMFGKRRSSHIAKEALCLVDDRIAGASTTGLITPEKAALDKVGDVAQRGILRALGELGPFR